MRLSCVLHLLCIVPLFLPAHLFAQTPLPAPPAADAPVAAIGQPEAQQPHVVDVSYDLRDLWRAVGRDRVPEEFMEDMQRLVVDAVAPDEWKENGGATGTIQCHGTIMVVTTLPQRQAQIAWLLGQLRRALSGQAPAHDRADAVVRLLARPMSLEVQVTPLAQAIELFRHASGLRIRLDRAALESSGVDLQSIVSLHAVQRPAGDVLHDLLDASHGSLVFDIDSRGNVVIGTSDMLADLVTLRMYDIRPLLHMKRHSHLWRDDEVPAERVEDITRYLMVQVDSAGWRENGGMIGGLRELGGVLLVTETPLGQARIAACLKSIERGTVRRLTSPDEVLTDTPPAPLTQPSSPETP